MHNKSICFFAGHSDAREGIYPALLEAVPYKWVISKLNRMMVDQAGFVIAYVIHSWGGAAATLAYAQTKKKTAQIHIENIAPPQKIPFTH